MATIKNKILYGIDFEVDKQGINEAIKQLESIHNLAQEKIEIGFEQDKMGVLQQQARELQKILQVTFDPRQEGINLKDFNTEIATSNTSFKTLGENLQLLGTRGKIATTSLIQGITKVTKETKQSETILTKMGKTLTNTIRWQISSAVVKNFSGSINEAIGYVKHLDGSLNDIRIVTGKSADEMQRFAKEANTAAKQLGATTTDYTEAALLFAQQGRPYYA